MSGHPNGGGTSFPHGTLLINLSGSLLVGFLLALSTGHFLADPRLGIMLIGGFLGAYTTFSAYTYESVNLVLAGRWLAGALNLLGSAVLGGIAAGAGMLLGGLL